MNIKEKITEIINKSPKKREQWEHQFLLKMKYGGNVRDYLLSMGAFKDEFQEMVREKIKLIENEKTQRKEKR